MKNYRIEIKRTETGKVAVVPKEFAKKACIYGTEEYEKWEEILSKNPGIAMEAKTIKKNPDKKTNKNMTYKNMELYIREQENSDTLLKEFERQKRISKIQTNPYKSVLAWFCKKFEGFDDYKEFFKDKEENEETKETVTEENAEEIEETTESNVVKMAK